VPAAQATAVRVYSCRGVASTCVASWASNRPDAEGRASEPRSCRPAVQCPSGRFLGPRRLHFGACDLAPFRTGLFLLNRRRPCPSSRYDRLPHRHQGPIHRIVQTAAGPSRINRGHCRRGGAACADRTTGMGPRSVRRFHLTLDRGMAGTTNDLISGRRRLIRDCVGPAVAIGTAMWSSQNAPCRGCRGSDCQFFGLLRSTRNCLTASSICGAAAGSICLSLSFMVPRNTSHAVAAIRL
jgi:hypothetical protein